jgi:hypothetical protein
MTVRRARLKLLWDVRQSVRTGAGGQWRADLLHGTLASRLATEFQGYAVALHDAAATQFVTVVAGGNRQVAIVLRERMTQARALSRGNATPDALTRDFSRIGLTLWPALGSADSRATSWKTELQKLVETRNAVVHADDAALLNLRGQGYPLTGGKMRDWQQTLNLLTATMDDVVSDYLSALLGVARPW